MIPGVDIPGLLPPPGILADGASGITEPATVRFASEPYISTPTDNPANTYWRGTALQPLSLRRTALQGDAPNGLSDVRGFIDLARETGGNALELGTVSGRPVIVRGLKRGDPLSAQELLFQGRAGQPSINGDLLEVPINDRTGLLERALQTDAFAGTGGVEGGADLEDKPKPAAYGYVFGVSPVFLGLIGGNLSYQVSGGAALPIQDVPAAYVDGNALTKVASGPVSGEYSIDTATGILTAGGTFDGNLTCDIEGYAPSATLKSTAADIIEEMLVAGPLTSADLDTAAFTALNTAQPAAVGFWAGSDPISIAAAVDDVLSQVLALGGFNRSDIFSVSQLTGSPGTAVASFDDTSAFNIDESNPPAILNPPAWRHSGGWQKNHTVTNNVVALATEAQRAFMAVQYRESAASDSDIALKYVVTRPYFWPANFRLEADAAAEATRRVALFKAAKIYRIETYNIDPAIDIGAAVTFASDQKNITSRTGTVIAWRLDLRRRLMELEVFA